MGSAATRLAPLLAAALAAALAIAVFAPAPTSAQAQWAPADEASIQPGSQAIIDDVQQCTTNFVFTGEDGQRVFIGMAAHCAGEGQATDVDGCQSSSRALGTKVAIEGAEEPGELVYSSWLTMQERGEDDGFTCMFNDFALVELDPADHGAVNPSVPFWGGPQGLNTGGTAPGEDVVSYGNSSLRLGLTELSPKRGASLGTQNDGWNHPVYTVTPGVPGDSGSAFLDADGAALGSLSTLAIAPTPGSNGVADLNRTLAYLNAHGDVGTSVELAEGTEPFQDRLVPVDTEPLLGVSLLP